MNSKYFEVLRTWDIQFGILTTLREGGEIADAVSRSEKSKGQNQEDRNKATSFGNKNNGIEKRETSMAMEWYSVEAQEELRSIKQQSCGSVLLPLCLCALPQAPRIVMWTFLPKQWDCCCSLPYCHIFIKLCVDVSNYFLCCCDTAVI